MNDKQARYCLEYISLQLKAEPNDLSLTPCHLVRSKHNNDCIFLQLPSIGLGIMASVFFCLRDVLCYLVRQYGVLAQIFYSEIGRLYLFGYDCICDYSKDLSRCGYIVFGNPSRCPSWPEFAGVLGVNVFHVLSSYMCAVSFSNMFYSKEIVRRSVYDLSRTMQAVNRGNNLGSVLA